VFEVAYQTTFCATHVLTREGRPIEPQHGHDWRVEAVAAGEVAGRFHYGDVTTHPDFTGQSPSAEAVARYFFREVRRLMGPEGKLLRRVRIWEAPGCSATYLE
jgi:6-pyruvoyl-tetrahydropterin synthase